MQRRLRQMAVAGAVLLALLPGAGTAASQDGAPSWVRTGGPLGGLGYDVRMQPGDPDVMMVTDAWAGVFRSDDAGATWLPSSDGITARTGPSGDGIPVFSLTYDPHDPSVVWAGTQNVRGIFRSDDGGLTWTEMDDGVVESEGITFRGFTVDPRTSDIVYAAAELGSWVWAGRDMPGREFDRVAGVVYRTEDRGEHWTAIWRGDNLARYVVVDPGDPDVLYVSTGIFDREAADSDPGAGVPGGEGVVKSTDGGATWLNAIDGLGNLYVGSLALSPHDGSVLLAGTGNNQYHQGAGIYRSTDGAATWRRVGGEEDTITSVEFTADPAITYAASEASIYRSDDGGRTWERVSGGQGWGPPGVRAGFPIDLQADPRDPDRLFVNNYGGGNFISIDGGRTWATASRGYTGAQVRAVAADPAEPGRVYAASRSGLFVSNGGGDEWHGLGYGIGSALEYHAVAVDGTDPSHLLAATNWTGRIMTSDDGGASWAFVGPDLGEGGAWRCFAQAPADAEVVYAGSGAYRSAGSFSDDLPASGVFVSRDGGATWEPDNTELTESAHVADLAVHPAFAGFVYAAAIEDGLLRTFDGGDTWERVTDGLPENARVYSVAFDPHDPSVQVVGLAGQGIFRSSDEGANWQRVAAGLNPEAIITAVVFDPAAPGVAYASDASSGVYRSADSGATWEVIGAGLDTRAIADLAMSADGRHLYAATEGGGVYRLDVDGAVPPVAEPLLTEPEPEPTVTTVAAAGPEQITTAPTTTTTAAARSGEGDGDGFPWLPMGAGTAGAVVLAAAWWALRRRRG